MFSKEATNMEKNLHPWSHLLSKRQIDGEDLAIFCGLLRKHELYKLPYFSGEYKMMDDGEERHSVYVEKYDRVLEEGEFSMNGE